MRKLLFLLLVSACSSPKDIPDYSERYERIINGIQPSLQIEGEEIPTFSIEERLKEKGIPGMSLAVCHDGEIWSSTYGMADVGENRKVDHARTGPNRPTVVRRSSGKRGSRVCRENRV